MKRYLSIITTLFLLFTSAGCGADKDEAKGNGSKAQSKDKVEKIDVSNTKGKGIHHTNQKTDFRDSENADVIKSRNEHNGMTKISETGNDKITGIGKRPKNVIVMFGDGMGVGQMEVARLLEHGKGGRLFIESLPHVALSHTYSANNIVTDSAAAGTALAIGAKTNNEMIGVTPDGKEVDSILDKFKKDGKKVGIISTNTVTDASPAAYTASVANRWSGQEEVARQQLKNEIDVLLGGGSSYFSPKKQNGTDLVQSFKDKGYSFVSNRQELMDAKGDKLLGLFHPSYMNYKLDREENKSEEPTLSEMTQKALDVLSKGKNGFFLMSEGARIDHAAHAADITGVWKETIEFDQAVKTAVDFAKADGNTLVVVVTDHETMGIAATEPMDIEGLKKISVSPEYMAAKLKKAEGSEEFTAESIKDVFKTYANIDITDAEIKDFNERSKDTQGKVYAAYRVAWEIGSVIATHYNAGSVSSPVRSLSSTGGHTGNLVPIFSYGAGAEVFDGVYDNVDIPRTIAKIMGYQM